MKLENPQKQQGQIYFGIRLVNYLSRCQYDQLFHPGKFSKDAVEEEGKRLEAVLVCVMGDEGSRTSIDSLC